MRFSDILTEKRRNPAQNPKLSVWDQLEKFRGRRDVFVSFTQDVGNLTHSRTIDPSRSPLGDKYHTGGVSGSRGKSHNTRGSKLGLNPKTTYDTPLGIYSYPIDYVLHKGHTEIEFARLAPYIQVFEARGNFLNLDEVTDNDVEQIKLKLGKLGYRTWGDKSKIDSPGGQLWNAIFNAVNNELDEDADMDEPEEPIRDDYDDHADYQNDYRIYQKEYDEWLDRKERRPEGSSAKVWSKILRKLGYDGVIDYDWSSHEGQGIIHENEPSQAVFMSMKGIRLLSTVHNRYEGRTAKPDNAIWAEKPHIFLNLLRRGKLSDEQILSFLRQAILLPEGLKWEDLPQSLRARIQANPTIAGSVLLSICPLSPEVMVKLAQENPSNVMRFERPWPAVLEDYIVGHWREFRVMRMPPSYLSKRAAQKLLKTVPDIERDITGDPSRVPGWMLIWLIDKSPMDFAHRFWGSHEARQMPKEVIEHFLKRVQSQWGAADLQRIVLGMRDRFDQATIKAAFQMLPPKEAKELARTYPEFAQMAPKTS